MKQKIFSALRKLCENPQPRGVHLEALTGREGFFTARVDRKVRLLLKEREDDRGTYLEIVRFGSHDEVY